jgi:glutaredoxin
MTPVRLYTLSNCPWCAWAKDFFSRRSVSVHSIDYDRADPAGRRQIMLRMLDHGSSAFPFVEWGGRVVVGYDPLKYESLLEGGDVHV